MVDFAVATYIDPAGVEWPLTDAARGWFTLSEGVSGLGAASVALTSDPYPRGGGRLRHVQPQPRTIVWPIHVYGEDHGEFLERWRALARAVTSTSRLGPGTLEIARPDGTRRRISVYYQEGWEGQSQQGMGRTSDTAVITWWCEDPYWADTVPITEHREHSSGVVGFLPNFFQLTSGQVLGATTLYNPGDVTAWPVWTITGPASLVTITNSDTGEWFGIYPDATGINHGTLLAGEQVTVTTDPGRVRFQNGDNWTGTLVWPGSHLWGLPPGTANVVFQLNGASTGSAVDVTFTPRHETA